MGVGPLGFDHLSAFSARSLWYFQSATRRLDYCCRSGLDGLTGAGVGQVDGKARMGWEIDLTEDEFIVFKWSYAMKHSLKYYTDKRKRSK